MNALGFTDYVINGTIPVNTGTADEFGSFWYLDGELVGWDSPDGRVTMLPKIGNSPNADGEFPADEHYRGRTLSFKMVGCASSEANRQASKYLLAKALDLVQFTGIFVVNEEMPKQVTISRSGNNSQGRLVMTDKGFGSVQDVITPGLAICEPEASTGLRYLWEADVEVYCSDPRKYAVTPIEATFGGFVFDGVGYWGVPFDNPGNTMTQKIDFTVFGPTTGNFNFAGTLGPANNLGSLNLAVPSTPGPPLPGFPDRLDVDVYNQTIVDQFGGNKYYLRNLLAAPPWCMIPPGTGYLFMEGGLVGKAGSLTYYPAWV